jgi:hypothetical protein
MQKLIKKNLFLVTLLAILILPAIIFTGNNFASAQSQNPLLENVDKVGSGAGFQEANETSVSTIAGTIVNVSLGFLGIIFVCLIIYAGFLWMTAAGEEDKIIKAKNIIKNCIIGLIVLLSAWAIYNIISRIF